MVSTPFSPWPAMCAAASSRRRARVARERRGGPGATSPERAGKAWPRGAAGAGGERAAGELAIDFPVDGEEGIAEGDAGEAGGEAGAIAAGGGELLDGVRQGVAEAVEAGDAGKLGGRDAKGRLFH